MCPNSPQLFVVREGKIYNHAGSFSGQSFAPAPLLNSIAKNCDSMIALEREDDYANNPFVECHCPCRLNVPISSDQFSHAFFAILLAERPRYALKPTPVRI